MFCLSKLFWFEARDAGLVFCYVHSFQFWDCELLDVVADDGLDLVVVCHLRVVTRQPYHIQSGSGLKRTMNMIVLAGILSGVEVGGESPVEDRLSC